jgi:alkylation response protein AidB-like acyl-CoA dehydrogenase
VTDPITLSVAPSERREIVEVARELGRRELLPHALELDERRPGAVDTAWERVTEVGFDRALMAVEDGGAGLDADTLLLCLEELAAGDGGIAMLALLSNAALAVLPPEQLAQIPSGSRWALVPAPPDQLPTAARVHVEQRAGAVALSGRLCPAVGALGADGLVVVAREPEPVALAFPAGAKGVDVASSEPQLGLRAAAAACVSFSGAAADLALPQADAALAVMQSFALLRAGATAIARGVARRAQEMAVTYAETRLQGGVPIIEHDAVRGMLAAMAVRLSAAPCPTAASGVALGGGPAGGNGHAGENGPAAANLIGIKVATTDAAVATTTDAVQVFGGAGYMHETGIEKLMRDAKSLQVWPEPNWVGSELVADALSPQPGAAVQS